MRSTARHPQSQNDFTFGVGQLLRRGTTFFRILEDRGALVKLEHATTLEVKAQEKSTLLLEYSRGLIVPATEEEEAKAFAGQFQIDPSQKIANELPLDMYSSAQRQQLLSVMKYITELRALGYGNLCPTPLLEIDFERLKKQVRQADPTASDLSLRTIYDWSLKLDRAGGNPHAVLPQFHHRGGRGKSRLSDIADEVFSQVVAHLRSPKGKEEKIRPHLLEDRIQTALIAKIGAEQSVCHMPSRSTIARRMRNEFSEYEIALRNKGKAYADKLYRTWFPRDRATNPLEIVEFDDKDSRVFMIDEKTMLPYGRGYVTAGIDQNILVPMGFSISEKPRSTWSAICALTNAILPKDMLADEYSLVKSPVEFAGKPGIALFDNATYNHSPDIDLAAHDIGITPAWAKPRTPTEKAAIENFNGRMDRDFFCTLPGYAGEKSNREGLTEGMSTANMSVQAFRRFLLKWAYDVYCNEPGMDGYTPRQRWHEAMRFTCPRFPLDINRLRIAPTLRRSAQFRPEGLRFAGLIYQNDRLNKLKKSMAAKAKVEYRYDPRDMGFIYVFDANANQLFIVESAIPEYATGLSLYQHRLILKMARLRGKRNPAVPELMKCKEELRTLVAQKRYSPKIRERRVSNRVGELSGETNPPIGQIIQMPEPAIITDLESSVSEIDEVEMEEGDEGWDIPVLI